MPRERSVRPRRAVCLVAFAVSTAAGLAAHAQPNPQVRLEYERGPGADSCPDAEELHRAVAARLGYDPFAPSAKRTVLVRLTRHAQEMRGHLEVRNEQGSVTGARDVASPTRDCQELVSAISVAAAIAVDPIQGLAGPPPTKPEAPSSPPAADTPAPAVASAPPSHESLPPEPPQPEAPKEPVRVHGSVGALVAVGAEPAATVGFTLGMGVRRGPFSLDVEGRADLPSSMQVSGGSVSASLLLVSLVPCLHYRFLSGCALAGTGAFRADGQGITNPQHAEKPYGAAGARVAIDLPLVGVLALRLHADLLATLSQTTLLLDNRDAWTTPAVSGAVGIGFVGSL